MIYALLNWWDENPSLLTRCATALTRVADHIIAVDGAYENMPSSHINPRSSGDQADALEAVCSGAGIGLTVHRPTQPWVGDQVAKRTFLFQLAALMAVPGEDWLLVVDADEIVTEAPANLLDRLDRIADQGDRVGTVHLEELPARGRHPARRFFLADPSWRVEGRHYYYAVDINGETRFGWCNGEDDRRLPAATIDGFVMEHWRELRSPRRRSLARGYYTRRAEKRLEATP